jgi:hypothetical protein
MGVHARGGGTGAADGESACAAVRSTRCVSHDKSLVDDRYAVLSVDDMAAVERAMREQLAL